MKNLKLWAKKILVLTLSTAMTVSAVDIPVVAAAVEMSGSEDVQKEMRITGFAPLEDSIREQVLTIGASEEDIQFPDTLAVTIEQKGSVQEDTQKNSEDQQQGEETEAPEKEQEKEDQGEKEDQTEDQEKEPQEGQTENPEKEQQEGQTENPEKEQQEDQTENPEKEQQQEGQTENPEKEQQQEGQTENPEKEQQQEGQTENQEKENAGAEGTALTASVKESWLEKAVDVLFPPMEVYAADFAAEANEDIEETQQQTEVSVTQEEVTLYGITWRLNIEESDAEVFDSSEQSAGLCYVYTPVLPETDADGNALTVANDVELPQIYVLIEGHKVRTLSNSEVINIADVKPTNSYGQIVINSDNLDEWNNKILTGSVISTDLYDGAKGLVIDGGTGVETLTLNLTIRDLTINREKFMRNGISAIELKNGATLNLTLEGDNELYGAYGGAGIGVPNGTALVITEASSGSLYAKGGNGYGGAAGIGAISPGWNLDSSSSMPQERTCGYIGIKGGNVTAIGGTYSFRGSEICGAAGIGGSYGASLCQINITGGNVTAIGGMYAAGIGGGTDGSVTSIMISGGTVIAEGTGKGMRQPAAIGRGIDSTEKKNYGEPADVLPCGAITLDGGNITAKGNIGYGYVESGEYPIAGPNTKVTVSDEVFLTLDGEIQDGSQSGTVKNYKLNVTVFDTTFTTGQGQMTAKVEHNGSLIQEKISAKVTTPGQATFTLSFAHNTFAGTQTFMVTIDGKSEPYEAKADFKEDQTEYDLTAGKELYPVSLEFYDNAINNREVVVNSISVKQNGKDLKSTDYVQPGKITQVNSGIGKMMIFLPADEEGTTEITVKAPGINNSKSMTQSKVKVGKTGINTVAMCIGTLTLSVRTSKVNATDATLAVESNVMTWDLYIKESTQKIVNAADIISDETKHSQTAQKGEVHLTGLEQGKAYTYYMVAKKDDLISEIVSVSFTTPKGAKVFWEGDSSKGELYYENFFSAIYATENINQDGFTILVQGASECYTYLPLEKSCKIDLNGQNVINGDAKDSLKLKEDISVVFTDSIGDAEYHGKTGDGSNSLFNMASNSSLTIQGGSYYDYKELLKAQTETQTGRTLTIEGGSFYGKNSIDIGDGKVVLSGGTFYGGLSVSGICEIKDGYCVKYLTGENKGTYTTTLPAMGENIEIVPLPALTGELDLKIGNGGASSVRVETTLTATFTDKDSGNGKYIYTWYSVDGDKEEEVQSSLSATNWTTSTYGLKQADIRKRIYCEVTKEGTSGSVRSEMTYPVLGYPIDDATITLAKEEFEYDGTEKKPKATVFVSGEQKTEGVSYTVSYADNINAGKAKVIITGCGFYDGTAEKEFTITKKQGKYTIEDVADSYEYTGEEIRPAIVVKDDGKVIPESNYTVSYENNKMPGTAKICIKETEDGNYSFGPEDYKEFKIVHEHDWSYDVSGSVIRLECREKVCTCKYNKGTLTLSIQNSESLKYNGTTQNVAEVTQYPLGIYPEDKIKLEYTGDGLKDGKPKNAGSYTASMSIEEGGRTYTAKNDFEIQKAEPVIVQKPTAAGITWGETLADSALSGGTVQHDVSGPAISGSFAWKDATRKPNVADSNKTAYTVVFTPDDTVNYKTVETTVMLNIKPAGNTPNFPKDHMEVKYVCRKVKDVQLPDGWEWAAADQETELNVGVQVNATAVYTGEGHGNYETESTVIKITRLECKHTDTKLKDVVAASCGKEGYTGDTVCKDCDILLDTGSPTEALTHDYRESGRKAPTSYAEGEIVYTCIHCKDSYSEKIAKLPDGGNNGETSDGDGSGSSGLPAAATATPVPTAGGKTQSPAPAPSSEPVSAPSSKPASTPASSDNNKETKEPFIKGEDGKEGWQVIESQTDEATEGETIHVDMNGATTVPGTIFDSIRGRDITVTFDLGGGILWTVNGLDVTAQNAKDIDFGVTMGEQAGSSIPVDVINNVTGERYSMNLTLAYEGEFGFTATLTVNMDAVNAGLYANLFYYNPETGELEFMCAGKIDEAGNTELTFNHASDYTIVIDTEPMNGVVQDGTGTDQDGIVGEPDDTGAAPSGQTADEATDGNSGNVFSNGIFWILIGAAVVIVIAAVGAVCVLRRKKDDPKQSGQK